MSAKVTDVLVAALFLFPALGGSAGCRDPFNQGPVNVAYLPDQSVVAFVGSEARIYDADAAHARRTVRTGVTSGSGWVPLGARFAVSADGTTFAAAAETIVEVYRVTTGAVVAKLATDIDGIAGIAISRTGDRVAASVRSFAGDQSQLLVTSVATGGAVEVTRGEGRDIWSWGAGVAFSPDGAVLYAVLSGWGADDETKVYVTASNTATGERLWETAIPKPVHPNASPFADALAISADGNTVATGGNEIHLWRAADGTRDDRFHTTLQPVRFGTLAFSPDGQSLVATHFSNVISDPLVFSSDGQLTQTWPIEGSGCSSAVFSPDGTRVAGSCGDWVKIWNAGRGTLIRQQRATVASE
jgi:WD40 repeat protein